MTLSKFRLAVTVFPLSIFCAIAGSLSKIFIVAIIFLVGVIFTYRKIKRSNDLMQLDLFMYVSVASAFIYLWSVYQTPAIDIQSLLDAEYVSILLKYIFGPSVLYLAASSSWENVGNQRFFLRCLIVINCVLISAQIINGVQTGAVLGALHSSHMGFLAAISIAFSILFGQFSESNVYSRRILLCAACVALIFSLSRGPLISVVVGGLIYFFLTKYTRGRLSSVFILVSVLSANVFLSNYYDVILKSDVGRAVAVSIEELTGKDVLENGRVKLWSKSIDAFSESPVVGIGVNARRSWDRELSDGTVHTLSVHNYYLAVLLEAGLVGFVCVTFLIASLISLIQRHSTGVSRVLFSILIGVLVHQLTEVSLTTGSLMAGFLAWYIFGVGLRLAYFKGLRKKPLLYENFSVLSMGKKSM